MVHRLGELYGGGAGLVLNFQGKDLVAQSRLKIVIFKNLHIHISRPVIRPIMLAKANESKAGCFEEEHLWKHMLYESSRRKPG